MSIFLKTGRVKTEWVDYNNHMNLAFYILLFDTAWEIMLEKFNIGKESAINQKRSTFAVESYTTYNQEMRVGEEVDLNLVFLDHDKKRLIYKLEMLHRQDRYLAATSEVLSLYVDLSVRKVTEFETNKSELIDKFITENKKDFNPGELHLINKLKK